MPPPVTLTLSDDHGNSESVVLHGPGGKARIAVGEPGRHSGVWEIWSPRTKNDVYIANKNIAGTQKWSLHESGDWRYQWISRLDAWRYAQTDDRLIESWSPPPELGPTGWTSAFLIRVRHQDIVPIPGVSVPADVELIREPHENRAVAVFVVIARPDQGMLNLKGAVPLGGFTLMDGRAVLLVVSYPALTEEQNRILDKARAKALEMAPDNLDLASLAAPRMVAAGNMSDGTRSAWDMTLRPEDNRPTRNCVIFDSITTMWHGLSVIVRRLLR